jgi:hypothetical protein
VKVPQAVRPKAASSNPRRSPPEASVQRTVLDEQTGSIEFEPPKSPLGASRAEEERPVTGRAALANALRDVTFPATKQKLTQTIGDRVIEFRRGQPIRMGEALARAAPAEFASLLEAARAIHRGLDERRGERRQPLPADG